MPTSDSSSPIVPVERKSVSVESPHLTRTVSRWWCILRYYRKSQLAYRAVRRLQAPLRRLNRSDGVSGIKGDVRLRENPGIQRLVEAHISARDATESLKQARRICEGRFRLLSEERRFADGVDWAVEMLPEVPRLWRFHLHYHEYLLDLARATSETNDMGYVQTAWNIVQDWIGHNPPNNRNTTPDAWHPYCISRRLPVWSMLWHGFPSLSLDEFGELVLHSMAAQTEHLSRNLEWDLRGNHLLENTRALAIAGGFFAGKHADRWLIAAERILRKELPDQILPNGQHFERSPMYHALMLQVVLDVRDAVCCVRPGLAEFCQAYATRMADWLAFVLHPDGSIPLLSDSTFDETPNIGLLLARATCHETESLGLTRGGNSPKTPETRPAMEALRSIDSTRPGAPSRANPGTALPEAISNGEMWTWRDGGDFLIFDAGPVGADHLPAHAHSDLLTIEASLAGHRLIVDSGTFDYSDGPMREYCRSTRAHNVLQIDDTQQCDMWSRFRMGYRGWPHTFQSGQNNGFAWASAVHNAYRRLGVPNVGRWIACRSGGPWLCVDWARGQERHQLTSRLHFHPDVVVETVGDSVIRLTCGEAVATICHLVPGQLSVESGWYCPEFGLRQETTVLAWTACCDLPAVAAWCLSWDGTEPRAAVELNEVASIRVKWEKDGEVVQWELPEGS